MNRIIKASLKSLFVYLSIILVYFAACNRSAQNDDVKLKVSSATKRYLNDSLKTDSIIAFSNYLVVSEYDSLVMSIRYTNSQASEVQNNYRDALERRQNMDKMASLSKMFPSLAQQQFNNAYSNINSSVANCAHTLRLDSQIRAILFTKLKDQTKQQKTLCYKINCTYKDGASKIHNTEFTIDTLFKITAKSDL